MPYNDDDETIDMVGDTLYIISSTSNEPNIQINYINSIINI